jgi:methylated-DNA-[protein]-cysteine S-methyltransferase
MDYQAIIPAPFGKLGIRCTEEALSAIEFLPASKPTVGPCNALATKAIAQLEAYFADPYFHFYLPLRLAASLHQRKVWQAMQDIPCGQTLTYGELAEQVGSSAQAVGQACGSNPVPVIIPCHRVVSKLGLGGFMRHAEGESLNIKRWLLEHERKLPLPPGEGWGGGKSVESGTSLHFLSQRGEGIFDE